MMIQRRYVVKLLAGSLFIGLLDDVVNLTCGVDTSFLLTPQGVRKTPFIPLVKYPTKPPMKKCRSVGPCSEPGCNPLKGTSLWYKWGLFDYANELKEVFATRQEACLADLKYEDTQDSQLAGAPKGQGLGFCETRRMTLQDDLSYTDAFCRCNSMRRDIDSCLSIKSFVERTLCYSQYTFDANKMCPELEKLSTVDEFSRLCTATRAGDLSSLDLKLHNFLAGGAVLPEYINHQDKAIIAEGRTYYLAWMATNRLGRFADAYTHCGMEDVHILPGWQNLLFLYPMEEGEESNPPMIALSRRNHENILITVRDARTTFEGRLYAEYELTFFHMSSDSNPIQEGLGTMMAASISPLDIFLSNFFQLNYNTSDVGKETNLSYPRIIVTGSGPYGSSLAAVIAEYVATKWDDHALPWAPILTVDAILFGAPKVGTSRFASSFRSKVNARNIVSKYLGSNLIPCQSQRMCQAEHSAADTGHTGLLDIYHSIGGTLQIDPTTDPKFSEACTGWKDPASKLELVAQEVCVPKCWMVKYFCPDDPVDMCKPSTCPGLFHGTKTSCTA